MIKHNYDQEGVHQDCDKHTYVQGHVLSKHIIIWGWVAEERDEQEQYFMADYRLHVQWISLVIYARRCTQTPTNKSYRSSGWHCNQKPLAQPSLPLGWHRSLQYYQTQPEKKNGVQVYKCKELGKNPLILNTHNVLECGYADFQAQSSIDNGQYASKNIEACASIQAKKYSYLIPNPTLLKIHSDVHTQH